MALAEHMLVHGRHAPQAMLQSARQEACHPSQQGLLHHPKKGNATHSKQARRPSGGKPHYPGLCLCQARLALFGYPPRRTGTKVRKRPARVRHRDGNWRAVRYASGASCRCGQGAAAVTTNLVRKRSLAGLASRSVAKENGRSLRLARSLNSWCSARFNGRRMPQRRNVAAPIAC